LRIGDLFHSAGWEVKEVDGHSLEDLTEALDRPIDALRKPLCIVASTVKGKGVSFMEDDNNWHYRSLDEESYQQAVSEGLSSK
jgi:transketolase